MTRPPGRTRGSWRRIGVPTLVVLLVVAVGIGLGTLVFRLVHPGTDHVEVAAAAPSSPAQAPTSAAGPPPASTGPGAPVTATTASTTTTTRTTPANACPSSAVLTAAYRTQLQTGQRIKGISGQRCSSGWAIALLDIADPGGTDNAYTGLFQLTGTTWTARDPATTCPAGAVPAALRALACDAN